MFRQSELQYKENSLAPYISERTVKFHFEKHHSGYVKKLNDAVKNTKFESMSLEDVISNSYKNEENQFIFNNAAQSWNHDFYWKSMKKNGGGTPSGDVLKLIKKDFGSYEEFVNEFKTKALKCFGSGWTWLVMDEKSNKLKIFSTSNADNPLTHKSLIPLVTLDVWEHAYYLDYQNDRGAYIDSFLKDLINWEFVEKNLSIM